MTDRTKPADVRFYFDADVLGLAKVIAGLRSDVTFPGDPGGVVHRRRRPPCPVATPAARDTQWIPVVAEAGWLVVTRDSRIQHRRAEVAAVRDAGAKMVALGGQDAHGDLAAARGAADAMACDRNGRRRRRPVHLQRSPVRPAPHRPRLSTARDRAFPDAPAWIRTGV